MSLTLTKPLQSDFFNHLRADQKPKFGTFVGVYIPSILMLFGEIIFLRLGSHEQGRNVVIINDEQKKHYKNSLKLIKKFSSQAAMIFLSVRAPKGDESLEEYAGCFQTLPHKSQAFPPVALVMSAEQINLQEVMQIRSSSQEDHLNHIKEFY